MNRNYYRYKRKNSRSELKIAVHYFSHIFCKLFSPVCGLRLGVLPRESADAARDRGRGLGRGGGGLQRHRKVTIIVSSFV